jgi:hypothetical protein
VGTHVLKLNTWATWTPSNLSQPKSLTPVHASLFLSPFPLPTRAHTRRHPSSPRSVHAPHPKSYPVSSLTSPPNPSHRSALRRLAHAHAAALSPMPLLPPNVVSPLKSLNPIGPASVRVTQHPPTTAPVIAAALLRPLCRRRAPPGKPSPWSPLPAVRSRAPKP